MENHQDISINSVKNKIAKGIGISKRNNTLSSNKLTDEIKSAITELEAIRKYFETVDDPELIEYAIYREKAAIIRLSHLFKEAKVSNPNKKLGS